MKLNLIEHLEKLGLLTEMKNWYEIYQKGNPHKQIRPTDISILDFVNSLLQKAYEGKKNAKNKVVNSIIAPWLVEGMIAVSGVENIGTKEIEEIKTVLTWFVHEKSGGNINKIKSLNLSQASVFAKEAVEKIKKEEEESEKRKKEAGKQSGETHKYPQTEDEKQGKITRIYDLPDGSGRFWVKANTPKWFSEKWLNDKCKGVKCQTSTGGKYATPPYESYSLIGPPKGNPNGQLNTILSLSIINTGESWGVAEVKQENNQYLGHQATSGGWSDADLWTAQFLASNPLMQKVTFFSNDNGTIPAQSSGQYGGAASLVHMMNHKINTFNWLIDNKPEILENNYELIANTLGQDWVDSRNINIDELANENPIKIIEKIDFYKRNFGDKLVSIFEKINYKKLAQQNSELFIDKLLELIEFIPSKDFFEILKHIHFSKYIYENPERFVELLRRMALSKRYSTEDIFKLINEKIKTIVSSFGGGGKGINNFLTAISAPKLEQHKDAIFNKSKRTYERQVEEDGGIVYKEIPDTLSILPKKERKRILQNNKEFIKSLYGKEELEGEEVDTENEEDKEMAYWRLFTLETSGQQTAKEAKEAKDKIISYYNKKNKENPELFKFPGLFQYYIFLNKGNENYGQKTLSGQDKKKFENKETLTFPMKLEDLNTYKSDIIQYYHNQTKAYKNAKKLYKDIKKIQTDGAVPNKQKLNMLKLEKSKALYDAIFVYLTTMKDSGASQVKIDDMLINDLNPNKVKSNPTSYDFYAFLNSLEENEVSKERIVDYIKSIKQQILSQVGEQEYNDFIKRFSGTGKIDEARKYIQNILKEKFEKDAKASKKKISYSAIILDDKSRKELLSLFKKYNIPKDWEPSAHHMTIKMGELEDKSLLHKKIKLKAYAIGINDKVASVGVESPIEYYEEDVIPHITLAINRENGGTPKDSKNISKWKNIGRPFYIIGRVEEVPL